MMTDKNEKIKKVERKLEVTKYFKRSLEDLL